MGPFIDNEALYDRLRDGRSIQIVSVLLLQLVQTSAHDIRLKARKIEKNRQNQRALKRQESFSENGQAQESFLDENDHEVFPLSYKQDIRLNDDTRPGNCLVQRRSGLNNASCPDHH